MRWILRTFLVPFLALTSFAASMAQATTNHCPSDPKQAFLEFVSLARAQGKALKAYQEVETIDFEEDSQSVGTATTFLSFDWANGINYSDTRNMCGSNRTCNMTVNHILDEQQKFAKGGLSSIVKGGVDPFEISDQTYERQNLGEYFDSSLGRRVFHFGLKSKSDHTGYFNGELMIDSSTCQILKIRGIPLGIPGVLKAFLKPLEFESRYENFDGFSFITSTRSKWKVLLGPQLDINLSFDHIAHN